MTPLSPLDALGPAFRRAREVLGTPFRLGFFLKIALIAALTQPSFYSASVSYPIDGLQFGLGARAGQHSNLVPTGEESHFMAMPGLAAFGITAILIGILIVVAIWIVLTYLYCRLRFTLFDLVVYNRGQVRKAWSPYSRQSWRYFGMVILVSLAFMVIAIIIVGPTFLNLIRLIRPMASTTGGSNFDPFSLLGAMLPFLIGLFALAALWAVVDSLMQDFLLPPMAIEDAPLESAFGRFISLVKTNPGPLVIYVLLRFAVGIGLTWIMMLALFVLLLAGGLAIYGVGLVLYHALWASLAGQVICVALALLVGLAFIALYLIAIVSIYGFAAVFKQAYAVYFFGGRYAELGQKLEPPPPGMADNSERHPELSSSESAGLPPLNDAPPVW